MTQKKLENLKKGDLVTINIANAYIVFYFYKVT